MNTFENVGIQTTNAEKILPTTAVIFASALRSSIQRAVNQHIQMKKRFCVSRTCTNSHSRQVSRF